MTASIRFETETEPLWRMKSTRHSMALVLLLLILMHLGGCSGSSSSHKNDPPELESLDFFENGALYVTSGQGCDGEFNVLVLNGTWRDMGRQYGYLLRLEMNAFYETVVDDDLIGKRGVAYEDVVEAAEEFYEQQAWYVEELVEGMAETSGYSLEKMIIISSLVQLADLSMGCSSLAAWGDYTGGHPLVVGRNWDIGGPYGGYKRFLSIVIYNPVEGSHSVVDINFVGTISLQTGLTSSGLFLDLQNGGHSDPLEVPDRRFPTYVLFDFLLQASTLEEIDTLLLDYANLPAIGLIINVADSNEDRVYEWATYDVKQRTGNGLIASTNHFIDPEWVDLPEVLPGLEGDYSFERLANLLALGEAHKGAINAFEMRQIFDTTYSEGGPTFPEYTVYQVVAVPADQTIWVKALNYADWKRIDLAPLFSSPFPELE